jgi:flavin reductase (DIM6/NTAB) family NADH-FMN oxidoreductase RutF
MGRKGYKSDRLIRLSQNFVVTAMSDFSAIEAAFKTLDRELWIVTAQAGGGRGGLVATWVSPASLDRKHPVLLAGIAPNHYTAALIDASGEAGLHLIGREQMDLALNFAIGSGRERDKLAGVKLKERTPAPILADCVSWFLGRVFARLATGDRIFYWLDIVAAERERSDLPARESDLLAYASAEQKAALVANRQADIALQVPWQAAWRAKLPPELLPKD